MKPCDNWCCPFYTLGSKGGCKHRDECPNYSCDESYVPDINVGNSCDEDVQIEHVEYTPEVMGYEK